MLVDAEALAKVLMLLPHDAISHLPDEARAAQSLRNALTQPQPSSSAGETLDRLAKNVGWDRMSIADLELLQRHDDHPERRASRAEYIRLRALATTPPPPQPEP